MNDLTPAEGFRRRVAAMSRPQLEEAMRYLRACDEAAMDRALDFAAMPVTAPPGRPAPRNPLTVRCPDCGAPIGERCYTEFGCMTRYSVAQVAS